MHITSFLHFKSISIEKKLVLGITLFGVPQSWSLNEIVHNISLFTSLKRLKIISFISCFREFIANENGYQVHLVCDSLDNKFELLKIRLIPYVREYCGIIVIRPMKNIFKFGNVECIYTIPEYSNVDIAVEISEAMNLLDKSNISLKYAILIGMDKCLWDDEKVETIWTMIGSNTSTIDHMYKLVEYIKNYKTPNFKPFINDNKYDLNDIFDINSLKWIWEAIDEPIERKKFDNNSYKSGNYSVNNVNKQGINYLSNKYDSKTPNKSISYKNDNETTQVHGGCIRFEKNRNRWVADLTLHKYRSQKCFHVSNYGLAGGLQAARKWRYDYMNKMNAIITPSMEQKVFKDIWDKIHMMNHELWPKLVEAITTPIKGYEDIHNFVDINEYELDVNYRV